FVSFEQFQLLLDEIKESREESNRRFEESREEFNRRFEESREESNRRFESVEQRFEKHDEKFEEIVNILKEHGKRFDSHDRRLARIDKRLDDIQAGLGINFEGYNKNVLMNFLEAQGIPAKTMQWRVKIQDPERKIYKKSSEVEIDIFMENPLIIVEVTSIETSYEKVQTFIKIIKWLEVKYNKKSEAYYLLFDFEDEIREEALNLLQKHKVKIISTQT
ncbi:MAG: hypothetical protein ACC656_10395, partial [Candidatus Heimdallarchaeota archaeon]